MARYMYPIVRCTVQTCQVSALHKHLDKEELHSRQILIEWLQGEKIYDSFSPSSTVKLSIRDIKSFQQLFLLSGQFGLSISCEGSHVKERCDSYGGNFNLCIGVKEKTRKKQVISYHSDKANKY